MCEKEGNSMILEEFNKITAFNEINNDQVCDWEWSTFDSDIIFNEETPIIKTSWSVSDIKSYSKGIELRGLIFRSPTLIINGQIIDINITFVLKGESSCWIFNRVMDYFDEYSVIMRVDKEDKSQKLFISLGSFVRDSQNNLVFKIFCKQQLIDYSKIKNKMYVKGDLCKINLSLIDTTEEKVFIKVYVNDSKTENSISSEIFLPLKDNRRVMVAGSGEMCSIKSVVAKLNNTTIEKIGGIKDYASVNPNSAITPERKNCDCCLIM